MTRWVRSGSTQKHKKMPGNATKWGEFDNQKSNKISPRKQKNIKIEPNSEQNRDSDCVVSNVSANEIIDSPENNEKFSEEQKTHGLFEIKKSNKRIKLENGSSYEIFSNELSSNLKQGVAPNASTDKASSFHESYTELKGSRLKKKKKKKRKQNNVDDDSKNVFEIRESNKKIKLENDSSYESHSNELPSDLKQDGKLNASPDKASHSQELCTQQKGNCLKKQKKKKMKKNNVVDDSKNSFVGDKTLERKAKVFESKKEMYLKKLKKKRDSMGLLLLPAKVERKLYIIRKTLKEKGYPPQLQKEIIRKERRKEELKFRKTFNPSKLCFHCREPGHLFADCPKKAGSSNQTTGICFKCGSAEHTSFKCPEKVQGFPFARCFICKEQGHISKDCPRNERGIYPKGGRCNLCGNVNHMKKDCPSLKKKKGNDESNITLYTINEDTSIDAELMEKDVKKQNKKKPKIVKF